MMISGRKFHTYHLLLISAFALAILLRFLQLGVKPLTDSEARLALQALEIAEGNSTILDAHPGYIMLTAFNFFLFGSSNFLARFWPALLGACLVGFPIAFEKHIGKKVVVLLSFALALDPGLIAISRIAGSQMMALGFLCLFLAAFYSRQFQIAGVFAGLSLLAGPSIWFALFGIGITLGLIKLVQQKSNTTENYGIKHIFLPDKNSLGKLLLCGFITLILVGTLFFFVPNGLSAWAASIAIFLKGFWPSFPNPAWTPLGALFVYELLPILAGLIALVFVFLRNNRRMVYVGILALVFLLFASLYPAHQIGDLVWFIVPLWVLATFGLSSFLDGLNEPIEKNIKHWFVASVVFVILVFLYLNLKSLPAELGSTPILQSRILLILGSFVLLILTIFLVSAIWNEKISQAGLVLGGLIAMLLLTISNGTSAAGYKYPDYNELWNQSPQFTGSELMLDTIRNISKWRIGQKTELNISILPGMNDHSVRWTLRDYSVEEVLSLSVDSSPDLVIHSQTEALALSNLYLDQDFEIRRTPVFSGLTIDGWFRWAMNRTVPFTSEYLILSVRADILPVKDDADVQ